MQKDVPFETAFGDDLWTYLDLGIKVSFVRRV